MFSLLFFFLAETDLLLIAREFFSGWPLQCSFWCRKNLQSFVIYRIQNSTDFNCIVKRSPQKFHRLGCVLIEYFNFFGRFSQIFTKGMRSLCRLNTKMEFEIAASKSSDLTQCLFGLIRNQQYLFISLFSIISLWLWSERGVIMADGVTKAACGVIQLRNRTEGDSFFSNCPTYYTGTRMYHCPQISIPTVRVFVRCLFGSDDRSLPVTFAGNPDTKFKIQRSPVKSSGRKR